MNAHETLTDIQRSFSFLLPEFILAAGIVLIVLSVIVKRLSTTLTVSIATVSLLAAMGFAMAQFGMRDRIFAGQLSIDSYGVILKLLMLMAGLFTCLVSFRNERLKDHATEFYALMLCAILGGHFLVMSTNLLMIFLALEILSICSYLLAAFAFNKPGSEGSLKYFMFGSVASAVMLYGLSMFYGITGSLDMLSDAFLQAIVNTDPRLLLLMSGLVLAGFLFKIGAVPFHFWTPDAYQGAPAYVVAFLSTVPKLAGLGVMGRFLLITHGFGETGVNWRHLVLALALITITAGNVGALAQQNAKRMMAWSSIGQAGFLMIGLGVLSQSSIGYMLFYAAVFVVMNFLVFVYLECYERRGIVEISDFSGLGRSNPMQLIFLTIGLVALIGLPPTAGFTAKLLVFTSLLEEYPKHDQIMLSVLVIGLLNSVIALFYYLKIPYYAFLKDSRPADITKWHSTVTKRQKFPAIENLLALILVLVILALFFVPGLLMGWIIKVNFVV